MGVRRRLKQVLRQGLQRGQTQWQQILAPLQTHQQREKLAAINALVRIREVRQPEMDNGTGQQLVMMSHYHPRGWLQRCLRRELEDLRERGWSVLILSDNLNADGLAWCEQRGIGWLRRRNEGRDFGAFQDGWLWLQKEGHANELQRLVLLNDSVYPVMNLAASSWPDFLGDQGEEVLGFSDSFQNGYHLQSYGLHFPRIVLSQPWWDHYWHTYPGWGGMAIAIREGEIGLSQLLMAQGIQLRALHPVSRLRARIASSELLAQLQQHCSEPAAVWIQQQLLATGMSSFNFHSPAHYWAIPLLLDGCPFIKRWLLESNEEQMLDPLLVAGGAAALVDPQELADYLRPPIIGFAA